jgi:hypothetical protein
VHWLIAGILFGIGLILAPLVLRLTVTLLVWAAIAAAVIAVVLFSVEYPEPLILLLFLVGFGYLTRWIGKHDDQAAITAEEERRREDAQYYRHLARCVDAKTVEKVREAEQQARQFREDFNVDFAEWQRAQDLAATRKHFAEEMEIRLRKDGYYLPPN